MLIFLKTLNGSTLSIKYESTDSIRDIKMHVFVKYDIPVDSQNVIIMGKLAPDDSLFESYEPRQLETIHLIVR
jgi:hypothetical protein